MAIFADYVRISLDDAMALQRVILGKCYTETPREYFNLWIDEQRPRWKAEAEAGVRLLKDLTD